MCPCRHRRTRMSRSMMSGNGAGVDDSKGPTPSPGMMPAQESSDPTPSCCTNDVCGWQVVSASVRGVLHKHSGAPNQDALSWWSAEGEKALAVLCVADGHGGSEYTHSHIGARRAVENAQMLLVSEVLPRILDGSALTDLAQFRRHLSQQLPKDLVNRWRESIFEHAADEETARADAPRARETVAHRTSAQPDVPVERRYGATLLATLLTPELHLYIQLGDGDILTVSQEGEVARPPFPADSQLIANYTTSLCSKEAWRFVRIHFQPIVEKPPALVMLATDGYANSFADNAAFEQVAKDIYGNIQQDGPATVADLLPGWLRETSEAGSGDDISVVISAEAGRLR